MINILKRFKWFLYNIFTVLVNVVIHRDYDIWLFGSWMGEKFADNSRFLFQFLDVNKEHYGIKKVIWFTRDKKVYEELKKLGYIVCLDGTLESFYIHLKSGVHVICNMSDNVSGYKGDINGRFSFGAKKIQLWHGIGVKACGGLINKKENKATKIRNIIKHCLSVDLFSPGGWEHCYWLVTSEENKRVAIYDYHVKDSRKFILSNYPRFQKPCLLLDYEKEVIEKLKNIKKKGYYVVIYLPTFRNNKSFFVHPLSIKGFKENLIYNNILWVEKRHSADLDIRKQNLNLYENIYILNPDFDINVLLELVDVVITDYSSVISDAVAKGIKTINYIPDFNYYNQCDRGFVADFRTYNPGIFVYNKDQLIDALNLSLTDNYYTLERKNNYNNVRELLFESPDDSYEEIMQKILALV